METTFTPWMSLAGGMLIGLAATLLMATLGRIMGATGVLSGVLLPASRADWSWRAVLLAGMVTAPLAVLAVSGRMPVIEIPVGPPMLVLGGLLVGLGVTFGSGCTSGHGVCGIARLSPRSVAATVTFMLSTAVTVYVIRHVLGG
jgi:hypothetical protein